MANRYPKKITVVAEPNPHSANGYDFRLEDQNGKQIDTLVFRKDDEPGMKRSDCHEVKFKLEQDQGMTLEFAQTPADALWVAWGTETEFPKCPNTQPSAPDAIFYAEKSGANTLTAINKNPKKMKFRFALNFVDPHSATPTKLITYDPDGGNENGGEDDRFGFIAANNIALGVAAIAVVALLYGVTR